MEKGRTEDVFNFILPIGRDFVVESEDKRELAMDAPSEGGAESSFDDVPAVRRVLSLSEDLGAEVIDVTFDEVFSRDASSNETAGDEAEGESVAFVLEPRPVLSKVEPEAMDEDEDEDKPVSGAFSDEEELAVNGASMKGDTPSMDPADADDLALEGAEVSRPLPRWRWPISAGDRCCWLCNCTAARSTAVV